LTAGQTAGHAVDTPILETSRYVVHVPQSIAQGPTF
jgi:hypothetical protein